MSNLTKRDLEAVAKAFGHIFTLNDMFKMAQKAEKRMLTDVKYRRTGWRSSS